MDYTAWGLVMHTDNDAAYASATISRLSCVFTLYGTEIALSFNFVMLLGTELHMKTVIYVVGRWMITNTMDETRIHCDTLTWMNATS